MMTDDMATIRPPRPRPRPHELTFGLKTSLQLTSVDHLRAAWAIADDGGFESLWVFDHLVPLGADRTGDVYEAWTMLAAMAVATRRVRIGCLVTDVGHRHPGLLAKMAVTVDHLSGGRLEMGLGAGGDELVDTMLGLDAGPPRIRLDRLSEAIEAMAALWTEPVATLEGGHYRLLSAIADPKPVQRPHPPLWIGSSGERRGLRVVAEHADVWVAAAWPGTGVAELRRLSAVLDEHCAAVGRDPATIRRAVQVPLPATEDECLATVRAHADAGFTDLVLMVRERGDAGVEAAERAASWLPRLRELVSPSAARSGSAA